jgi:2-keto-3-deoxy-L-rhamnonate aldolase RhmA
MANARLGEVVSGCIRQARAAGRYAGILVGPGPLLRIAIDAGCNLCFCGGDYANLIPAWQQLLETVKRKEGNPA